MTALHEQPLVSVLVPVYNTGMYIEKCVRSVLDQPYTNIEVLLVDDGSDQETRDVLQRLSDLDRVSVLFEEHRGASHARNVALKNAAGDYISFVDSDDCLIGDPYTELIPRMASAGANLAAFGRESDRDAFTSADFADEVVEPITALKYFLGYEEEGTRKSFYLGLPNKLFHRSCLLGEGGEPLQLDESLSYLEDGNFMIDSFCNWTKVVVCPKVFYRVTSREVSQMAASVSKLSTNMLRGFRLMVERAVRNGYSDEVVSLVSASYRHSARYYIWQLAEAKCRTDLLDVFNDFDDDLKQVTVEVLYGLMRQKSKQADAYWKKMKEFEARLLSD